LFAPTVIPAHAGNPSTHWSNKREIDQPEVISSFILVMTPELEAQLKKKAYTR